MEPILGALSSRIAFILRPWSITRHPPLFWVPVWVLSITFWNLLVRDPPPQPSFSISSDLPTRSILGAPSGFNFPRFQNAMRCPLLTYNASIWGHADFLDPVWRDIANRFCVGSKQPSSAFTNYRSFVAGLVTGFIQVVLQEQCTVVQRFLLNTTTWPAVGPVPLYDSWSTCSKGCPSFGCVASHDAAA